MWPSCKKGCPLTPCSRDVYDMDSTRKRYCPHSHGIITAITERWMHSSTPHSLHFTASRKFTINFVYNSWFLLSITFGLPVCAHCVVVIPCCLVTSMLARACNVLGCTSCPNKKGATLFVTITLAFFGRFLYFFTVRNKNEYFKFTCNLHT